MHKKLLTIISVFLLIVLFLPVSVLSQKPEMIVGRSTVSTTRHSVKEPHTLEVEEFGVGIYWDATCTNTVEHIDWGTLEPGGSVDKVVYIKNERSEVGILYFYTYDWNSPEAEDYLHLTWDYNNLPLNFNEVVQVAITLYIDPDIQGITEFSFNITVGISPEGLPGTTIPLCDPDRSIGRMCAEQCGASPECHGTMPNYSTCCVKCMYADFNKNEEIDIFDVRKVAKAYGSLEEDDPETPWDETELWDPEVDFDGDCWISILDIRSVAKIYGMDCTTGEYLGFAYYPIVIIVVLVILVSIFGFLKFFARRI